MKRLVTIPLSFLYRIIVAIRHMMYDRHLLISHTVDIPTICVGNVAVGGTGKTPMTAYIVQLLLDHGYHPAILSRGYKRKSSGFKMADPASTVDTIGDEMMQLHRAFPDVPVAVCENRVRGVRQLLKQIKQLDVIVLDDAMQHRAIRCGFNVLLTTYDHLYIDDHMLPWGSLRDLPSRALQADAVVVTKCPDDIQPIDMRVVDNRLHLPTYQELHFAGLRYAELEQDGVPLVVCGIAQPAYMMQYILQHYPQARLMAFEDHHPYSQSDVEAIVQRAEPFDFVITTEKDIQRLRTTELVERLQQQGKRLIALPIRTIFYTPNENFDRRILTYVRENKKR